MPVTQRPAKGEPRGAAAGATLRMIRMLRLVPRHPNKKTARQIGAELASEGFAVAKRSVERDLRTMQEAQWVDCDGAIQNIGWFVPRGVKTLQVADMTPAEALALYMGKKYLSALLPPAVLEEVGPFIAAAEETLKRDWSSQRSAWRHKVAIVPADQPLLPPRRNRQVEAVVYQALLDGRQLDVRYGSKDAKEQCIHPLALVQRGPVTYLVVRYAGYDNLRILAVHRIRSATACLGQAVPPAGFTLAAYLREGGFGFHGSNQEIALSLAVNDALKRILEETPLSKDQRIESRPGSTVVTAGVRDNAVLERWLLSLGAEAQVLEPKGLRQRVGQALAAAAAAYAPEAA